MKTKLRLTDRKRNSVRKLKGSLVMLAIISLLAGGLLTSLPTQASAEGTITCKRPNAYYMGPYYEGKPSVSTILFMPSSTIKLHLWHNPYEYSKFDKYQIRDIFGGRCIYTERSKGNGLKENVYIFQYRWDNNLHLEYIQADSCNGRIADYFYADVWVTDANGKLIDHYGNWLQLQFSWW